MRKRLLRYIVIIALLGLVAAACSSDEGSDSGSDTTTDANMTTMDPDMNMDETFSFGEPADASSADRVVEVTASDDFTFDPPSVAIEAGETVTFRVTNAGAIPHDFTLGDEEMQAEHEAEMAEMSGDMSMHDEPNTMVIEPGETMEMTWHFTESGPLIYGCHQAGHYDAGMKGMIAVTG